MKETFSLHKKFYQTPQQTPDADHSGKHRRNKSNMSDWNDFFNSDSSEADKEEHDGESVHSDAAWDDGSAIKLDTSTPRFPRGSALTSPGQSMYGSSDLGKSGQLSNCKDDTQKS